MARERNGWSDDGTPVGRKGEKCPNCGSAKYVQTLSRESCPACGLECDYWGSGTNAVYDAMMERDRMAAEDAERSRSREDAEA